MHSKGYFGSTIIIVGVTSIRNTNIIKDLFKDKVYLDTEYQEDDFLEFDI